MKILLVFTFNVTLQSWFDSGIIYREISLYQEFKKRNITVHFLTYGDNKDLEYSNLLDGIVVHPIAKYIDRQNRFLKFLNSFLLPFKLKKLFKEIDIIKTNQIEGCWVAFIAKILYKKKLVIRSGYDWLRDFIDYNKVQPKKSYLKYLYNFFKIYLLEFLGLKFADEIIVSNELDINFIIKTFHLEKKEDKIHLAHNYIDINLFKPLNLRKKEKQIIYVGKLYKVKNLVNLVLAIEGLKGFTLDIVGTGPDLEKLKSITRGLGINVNFLGQIPNNQLPEILNQYQIFILPSFYEGNPKALLEAMSCGIACIGTNVRGINNIIKHKINGYLCYPDSESIRNAIIKIHKNKDLRNKIEANARAYVVKNCSLENIAEKELRLYQKIMKN
jgi:glycosyltransferase involved in cell wall biosynthesis